MSIRRTQQRRRMAGTRVANRERERIDDRHESAGKWRAAVVREHVVRCLSNICGSGFTAATGNTLADRCHRRRSGKPGPATSPIDATIRPSRRRKASRNRRPRWLRGCSAGTHRRHPRDVGQRGRQRRGLKSVRNSPRTFTRIQRGIGAPTQTRHVHVRRDSRDQFVRTERLHQIIVGTDIQPFHTCFFAGARRKQEDANVESAGRSRIAWIRPNPSSRGIITSDTTRSGTRRSIISSAWTPSTAVSTSYLAASG